MEDVRVSIKIAQVYLFGVEKLAEILKKKGTPQALEIIEEYMQATLKDNVIVQGLSDKEGINTHEVYFQGKDQP
ncbi:hypothetical protein [Rossellomorea marisflavi]|uniref:hypothetical protein n=1 Tax=Rossellomorea marisflavi TaxID=189381 RepID=UPI00345CA5DD